MTQPISILSLEDSPLDYELICLRLQKEGIAFKAKRVDNEKDFSDALQSTRFDLILSDYSLPNFDGIAALALARGQAPDTPFIFVSGALGEDIAIESLKNGAVDYITKQRLGRLGSSIQRALREAEIQKTQRKTERSLQEISERLELALEATSDGFWDWDIPGKTIYWSDRFKELLGYPPEFDISPDRWTQIVHPDDRSISTDLLHEYIEKRSQQYRNIYRLKHADGSYRWMHSRGKATWDAQGNAVRMAGCVTDVTERKEASFALQESEKRWRTLTEAMPQLVWIDRGVDGYCEYLSLQWAEYSGIPVQELLGFAWLKLVHPDDEDRTAKAWAEAVAGIADYNIEYRIRRHDGEYRWFKVRGVPVRDENGVITVWYGTCTDIHDLKLAESRAEAANKAKSDFLANMSHEIRTPMNAVIGLSSILNVMPDLNARQKEIVETLQMSAQSLLSLINDLLDISKIETNMVEIERIAFTPHALITDIVNVMTVKATERNIRLSYRESPIAHQPLWGDPTRIRQVLMNLVSNGIKFTEKGGVTVTLDSSPHEEPSYVYLHIHVSDTGIGIAREKIDSIFDKFTQADSSTTRKYGGTGLGLAISKNLAEIMGGGITVKSEVSIGTEFTLHLPLEKSACLEIEITPAKTTLPARPASHKGTVLLVEDYGPNVMVAKNMLANLGYDCDVASNGREAIALLRAERPRFDAVLMDVQMPDMDGLEATRLIRLEEHSKQLSPITIVAMTAHAMQEDRERCLSSGMNAYIAKPFQPQTLKQVLEEFVARKAA